jgi:CHAT domain-containing protein
MVSPHTNGCPEPEVLAAYVDRGLSLSERARVDAHLASCPQCIALVAGVARTVEELSVLRPNVAVTAEAPPLITRRSVAGALAAAAAVIAVLATPALVRPWLERDPGLVSLVESVGEQRSVLGRLTGGFPHAPLGAPSAGGQDGRPAGTDRVQLAAGRIRESFGERKTPSQLHAIGVSQLLAGQYDDAALSLLAASREQPANAQYLSDVAAVQIERARLGLRPDDLPRALAAADRACRLDPSLKEAWFNRALAASALSLTAEAKNAWTEYLKRDNTSLWAGEAKKRLDELAKPTIAEAWTAFEGRLDQGLVAASAEQAVRAHMTEARRFIDTQLIGEWAEAVVDGRDASDPLNRLRLMADAMHRVGGDALYRDTVAAIDAAESRGGADLVSLARAHQRYADAAVVYGDDEYARAQPLLREAKAALEAAGTPYAIRAALDLATVAYLSGGYAEAGTLLDAALSTARTRQYVYSEGRATWLKGLSAFVQGHLAEAQTQYEDTLATFERAGDEEQISAAHTLLAGLFYYLGDNEQAWTHFIPALRGLDITRSLKLRHGLLSAAASSVRATNPDAALAIQEETVRNAQKWGAPAAVSEAQALRAAILADLGRGDAAQAALTAARQQMAASRDEAFKSRLEITVLATESEVLRAKDPRAAVAAAERAIALVEKRRDRFRMAQLQLKLAQANIAWGRTAEAQAAIDRGIRAFDEEQGALVDEGRVSSRDEAWGLFDAAVHLAFKSGDLSRAFAMAERARVRTLAEARQMRTPRTLREVQTTLAANEAIVALNQFEDEIAIWVIRATSAKVITRPLGRRDAQLLVARHQDEIWQEAATAYAGASLYNQIFRPIAGDLRGASRLIVVPDATYDQTSFAALQNTATNRFLIEEATLRVSPSANAFAASVERDGGTAGTSALVVGNRADAGARAIAAIYPSAALLVGPTATRKRFFAEAVDRSIIHLAAPVTRSATNPLLSRVEVADELGLRHSGTIIGSEIAARPLPRTQLIVIDEVGTSTSNRGEGTLSMARAFMAAGVPAVVGTLPGANENAARDLMIGFHREMSQGVSAEQALHTVQRNAIEQNGRRLGAWTALVLYGSDR